ncbi:MAG: hypothetical protein M3R70_08605 [Actinomycetota bacterium]|nr:hypothetical protein [Actinomycetota bacterium]
MRRFILVSGVVGVLGLGLVVGTTLLGDRPASAALQAGKCSKASLDGSYGIRFDGHSVKLGRFASVSLWKFDGKGGMKASETYDSEKTGPQTRRIAGKYKVKGDCTFQLLFGSELVRRHGADGACVLTAGGKQFFCLDVEKGWVTTGTGSKV